LRCGAQSSWLCCQPGLTLIGPKGASWGTAVHRREPVYVADIRSEPAWDEYHDRIRPYGIRAVWSRPLFTQEGAVLGTFAVLYREVRNPDAVDVQLIENASQIAGIAIERHMNAKALRHERDRLRLLLEITNSTISGRLFARTIYYRLKVFPINVPALRQRTEGIPKLVWHFTELYARRMNKRINEIPSQTMDALVRYRWPGNIRELQNFIERAVILSPHSVLRASTSELETLPARGATNVPITGLEELSEIILSGRLKRAIG
jgi:GAF domain-containing protein